MPSRTETPATLTPYLSLGVPLDYGRPGGGANGEWIHSELCPFCGRDDAKFAVNAKEGNYKCVVCDAKGPSPLLFLRAYWEHCKNLTPDADYQELADSRKLMNGQTLREWDVIRGGLLDCWLIPGYDVRGHLCQLYRYVPANDGSGKMVLKATAGMHHGLFGANLYNARRENVYVCEGPWDGMALWEILAVVKEGDSGYEPTANPSLAVGARTNVVAVPGVTTFRPEWAGLLAEKTATLMYDNDHPREYPPGSGKFARAGYDGMKRVAGIVSGVARRPNELRYLYWGAGANGLDGFDPNLPNGFDVRDALGFGGAANPTERSDNLTKLIEKTLPIPPGWIPGRLATSAPGSVAQDFDPDGCKDWKSLHMAWRKSGLRWTAGLDRALSVILASIYSTPLVGEQLWTIVMAPPSSAKTILCEAVSLNRTYCFPTDTFTSLVSGYQIDKEGSENMSLVRKLHNKTLVINDGDTLLRLPNREQVLSQLRAFYGRNIRAQYGNRMSKDNEGINTTIVMAGTGSLLELDAAELGARFITCDLGTMTDEMEDEIGVRVAYQAARKMLAISDGKPSSRDNPEMVTAKAATAAYVNHLRMDPVGLATPVVEAVERDTAAMDACRSFARLVSYLRSRPPKKQEEKVEKELSFRLIEQYVRLMTCLTVVTGRQAPEADVLDRVRQTALDTAQGVTFNIARVLYREGRTGLPTETLTVASHLTDAKANALLLFLRRMKVIESFTPPSTPGTKLPGRRWRLTPRVNELYRDVVEGF